MIEVFLTEDLSIEILVNFTFPASSAIRKMKRSFCAKQNLLCYQCLSWYCFIPTLPLEYTYSCKNLLPFHHKKSWYLPPTYLYILILVLKWEIIFFGKSSVIDVFPLKRRLAQRLLCHHQIIRRYSWWGQCLSRKSKKTRLGRRRYLDLMKFDTNSVDTLGSFKADQRHCTKLKRWVHLYPISIIY